MGQPSKAPLETVSELRLKIAQFEAALAGMETAKSSQSAAELGQIQHVLGADRVGYIDLSALPAESQVAFRQVLYQAHFTTARELWGSVVDLVNQVSTQLNPAENPAAAEDSNGQQL